MAFSPYSQPVTVTGATWALFRAAVAALPAATGYGYVALGLPTFINGQYSQQFRQVYPIRQWNSGPSFSVYNSWTTYIPNVRSNWRGGWS
jgi:hypothetical protein